ncbi:hypothetical protein RHABOEDO_001556 [Candidatus Rhabdochlamydia oedothoracis]|uniref:Uncharacterized protein n=1 Tax=Candidatus Rhabdochlamydia oedothoracis TaxID=2720720 RepID=A0ABX8V7S8_9BACT|nr:MULTISPECIES: hypothetical protein [Rhabdochlamydia]KAG6558962.1 hypothetical protein RHOW815_001042 [Candidatus Rhabdochlamydia sp. W815]MCL6756616.1 hypothetical protein [Candidatus Rhabdochlamydia oedothoracis]QYF49254.1 hypothetical protein RHABOEDO_001556 [Candidatus Rhabdochlamydia oedothoracis]
MSLSILETSSLLQHLQGASTKVQVTQMETVNQLTQMLQTLADQSLSEAEKMAFITKIAGYVQIATLFLGPLLVLGGILAAGGALSGLLSEAAVAGAEGSLNLTQGVLGGTQGVLETTSSEKKANIQKDKTSIAALQTNSDDTLKTVEKEMEETKEYTEGVIKILNNDAKIAAQKTMQ